MAYQVNQSMKALKNWSEAGWMRVCATCKKVTDFGAWKNSATQKMRDWQESAKNIGVGWWKQKEVQAQTPHENALTKKVSAWTEFAKSLRNRWENKDSTTSELEAVNDVMTAKDDAQQGKSINSEDGESGMVKEALGWMNPKRWMEKESAISKTDMDTVARTREEGKTPVGDSSTNQASEVQEPSSSWASIMSSFRPSKPGSLPEVEQSPHGNKSLAPVDAVKAASVLASSNVERGNDPARQLKD